MYLRISCYCDACLNSSDLRVGVTTLLNTIQQGAISVASRRVALGSYVFRVGSKVLDPQLQVYKFDRDRNSSQARVVQTAFYVAKLEVFPIDRLPALSYTSTKYG